MKAEYINHMGDDDMVVNAARVSFDKEATHFTAEKNRRLIQYLAKHNHWTPFAHPQITLRETVPIFVARQRFKHTAGFIYNEVSKRYVDDVPSFHIPVWRCRPENNVKQGSGPELPLYEQSECDVLYTNVVKNCLGAYQDLLDNGVAPEQARAILPQGVLTSYYVTGSLAAFSRAYLLRIDPHAQKEVQELAQQWDAIIAPLFPVSWRALTNGG